MVNDLVQTSTPDLPWITRNLINRSFANFERDTQFNTVNQSDVNPNVHGEVSGMMANILPIPEPSSEYYPEPYINESSRKRRTSEWYH